MGRRDVLVLNTYRPKGGVLKSKVLISTRPAMEQKSLVIQDKRGLYKKKRNISWGEGLKK